jgi:hypothetical protein
MEGDMLSNEKQIERLIRALKDFAYTGCDGKCSTCKLNKGNQDGTDNICDTLIEISNSL